MDTFCVTFRKLRLQVKEETEGEESMLKTGRSDALQSLRDEIAKEKKEEEEKLRYAY